jgi:D-glycero-alpha-D-manno-heptose 1-phosphate guanylyltransferase
VEEEIRMIRTCIILAGGLGTRLQSVVADKPKVMATVGSHPFLYYVFSYLQQQGIRKIILAVSHQREQVIEFADTWRDRFEIEYSIEEEPLGTGGAIRQAVMNCDDEQVLILNGDTFFPIDLQDFSAKHLMDESVDMSIALKPMQNFERYGVVHVDEANNISSFSEKEPRAEGNINGGIYALKTACLKEFIFPPKFSFEKDFMETHVNVLYFKAYAYNDYFIDIGIPEDYSIANEILPNHY